jgi:tetratricopeptide (TPR) repeat protein
MLVASHGIFSLSLVVCNSPALRDHLISELAQDHPGLVAISIPPNTIDVYGFVCEQVAAMEDRVTAACVTNMEQSLPLKADDYPTLRSLNASRELWKQQFSIPILFWMPDYAAALLSSRARDIWRWFNHQFEFVSVNIEPTLAISEQFASGFTDASNLDVDQKHFRIAELEERIQRAGNNPDADLIGHVRHWMNELAYLHYLLGQSAQAEESWRKLQAIEEDVDSLEGIANTYGNLGVVLQTRGDLDGAEEMYRMTLAIHEKLGSLEGMANTYGNLGNVLQTRGDLDGAEEMYRTALEINEKLGRLEGMASDYGNLGIVLHARGDLDGAEVMYRKPLEINEKLGRLEGMARNYGNLGIVMATRGDLDGAEVMFRKALEINEKLGRLEGMANQYGNLGIVKKTRGDLDGARQAWTTARDLYKKLGAPHMVDEVQGWLDSL